MRDFKVIGLMSGSSLDGLDIAYVNFSHDNKTWFFQIVEAGTIPYPSYWKEQLSEAFNKNEEELNSTLTEKQKETFEKFKDCMSELSCITEREAFSAGFILATRIMAEVMQGLEEVEDI